MSRRDNILVERIVSRNPYKKRVPNVETWGRWYLV